MLPATFNLPKSQLQLYGEAVYCGGEDMLARCARGADSLQRMCAVVAWSISTTRPPIFGFAPYNPVLGETHHVSTSAGLNVLLEQVSHRPPVTALHATHARGEVELVWCQSPAPRFHGASVEAAVRGARELRLPRHAETYAVGCPGLVIRLLPSPGCEWAGDVRVSCAESGLEATLSYRRSRRSFLGLGGGDARCVRGRVFRSAAPDDTLCEVDGFWDRQVSLRDVATGEVSVLYDARQTIADLATPVVQDRKGVSASESAVVWAEVSAAILNKDWEAARQAKRRVEETARRLAKERNERGEVWTPSHFSLWQNKHGDWECWPLEDSVPPAPIVVPSPL
ncbi:oxysterol-binding protein-related protein 4C-like isoform X1 [Zea mays]|uniref:oxysterol-binding protein-related protein 4C-like isoform X1 n=1 Tax=Zea mays TaxID=4577 RepID=UPI000C6C5D7B|nr:oxysterol-binding protein-related protein 4C-like isoform X1 [Zea mays]|eukprot:XP_023156160.1 oxysterol-binding protein-related protein 4C-like isoform X1 [Zea mays]